MFEKYHFLASHLGDPLTWEEFEAQVLKERRWCYRMGEHHATLSRAILNGNERGLIYVDAWWKGFLDAGGDIRKIAGPSVIDLEDARNRYLDAVRAHPEYDPRVHLRASNSSTPSHSFPVHYVSDENE